MFVLGAAAGAGLVWLWRLPTRRAVRSLREVVEKVESGSWRARAEVVPQASPDVRRLAEVLNEVANRTLRELKDLSRQRGDLRALVDALPDPLLLADTRRKIIQLNRPAAEMLGVSVEQALGAALESSVSEPAILSIFDAAAGIEADDVDAKGNRKLPLNRQIRLNRAGKKLVYQAVATRTDAGGVLVVLRDVSTLDQTLKMKADFVANAGHELRTPIAAIKAAFETLETTLGENAHAVESNVRPPVQRCLKIIAGHTQRLEEMLRDLLDLSRVENTEIRPTLERIRLTTVARDLRQTLGGMAAEKKIDLKLPGDDSPVQSLVTDHRVLMLAVKNLVENAIKYTPEGGRVWLEARPTDGRIVLEVGDTGMGIAPEYVERVFERFYQVDAARTGTNAITLPRTSGRGTGLGLAIVKHAVAFLGGTVHVRSTPGQGSVFTVDLPRLPEPKEAEQPPAVLAEQGA